MANYFNRRKIKRVNENNHLNAIHVKAKEEGGDNSQAATRIKMKLGELMIKAGLHNENVKTVLLGALLEIKDKLDSKQAEEYRRTWWLRGDQLLSALSAQKIKEREAESDE